MKDRKHAAPLFLRRALLLILALVLALSLPLTEISAHYDEGTAAGADENSWQLQMEIQQDACYVFDLERGSILFEKNAREERRGPLAVNLMLALLALENLDSQISLTVSQDAAELSQRENILAVTLEAGARVKPDYLLYALFLYDSKAAGRVLGEALYEDNEKLLESMNNRARGLGMDKTRYYSSYKKSIDAYTSLSDIGRLITQAYANKKFAEIFQTQSLTYLQDGNMPSILENRLYSAWTWSNDRIKGGMLAGDSSVNSLAFSAEGEDYTIIVLSANPRSAMIRNQDMINQAIRESIDVIDAVFAYYEKAVLVRRGEHCKDIVQQDGITISLNYLDTAYYLRPQGRSDYRPSLQLSVSDTIPLPVIAGERLGQMIFTMPDSTRYAVNVGSSRDIYSRNSTLDGMMNAIRSYPQITHLVMILVLLFAVIFIYRLFNFFVKRILLLHQERRRK